MQKIVVWLIMYEKLNSKLPMEPKQATYTILWEEKLLVFSLTKQIHNFPVLHRNFNFPLHIISQTNDQYAVIKINVIKLIILNWKGNMMGRIKIALLYGGSCSLEWSSFFCLSHFVCGWNGRWNLCCKNDNELSLALFLVCKIVWQRLYIYSIGMNYWFK